MENCSEEPDQTLVKERDSLWLLNSSFCSFDLCVFPVTNIMLYGLLQFCVKSYTLQLYSSFKKYFGSSISLVFHLMFLLGIQLNQGVQVIQVVKNPPATAGDAGDAGWIPGSGRSSEGGHFKYSCLGNPMDRGAWKATVHGVAKSWIQLSTYT